LSSACDVSGRVRACLHPMSLLPPC
jgi:hypothetical protein